MKLRRTSPALARWFVIVILVVLYSILLHEAVATPEVSVMDPTPPFGVELSTDIAEIDDGDDDGTKSVSCFGIVAIDTEHVCNGKGICVAHDVCCFRCV
jgi:hypothetical protein